MCVCLISPLSLLSQLSVSQAEVERLKLELMSVTSKAEQDKLVMQEKMLAHSERETEKGQ